MVVVEEGTGTGAGAALPPNCSQFEVPSAISDSSPPLLISKEDPGLGNLTFLFAGVVHPLPTFAMYNAGRLLYLVLSLAPEPVILIGAQFMYISRLPTLLNHVQANTASPAGRAFGILKLYVSGIGFCASLPLFPAMLRIGQPPWME